MPNYTKLTRNGEAILPNLMPDGKRAGWDLWTLMRMYDAMAKDAGLEVDNPEGGFTKQFNALRSQGQYTFTQQHLFTDPNDGAQLVIEPGDVFTEWYDPAKH